MSGKLHLVGTPIGNLGDLSPRAQQVLAEVDFIAAEDTRVTLRILNHLCIKKPLVSYFEHNRAKSGQQILQRLLAGESCALVTDAGMPAISDPGEDLVKLCAENGVEVVAVPGPSACVTALALSGLPTGRFTFEGFLSTAKRSRFEHLESLKTEKRTMIFYEAPHKLIPTLRDMQTYFGPERRIALCRELTKLHEEVLRMTLAEAVSYYDQTPPKGEFVLVIEGAPEQTAPAVSEAEALLRIKALRADGVSLKEACRRVSEETGLSKNVLYDRMVRE
ncbi:MAG: 16S rRNA (cytidine(1402)-2'-O)-methyltransferase [Oscillospiraceae bacterium]|nr:16S rRNA (cytidine(1402)-2'-O)-methyltransferase [Oscillospiraceae bacterium]